MTFRIPRWPLLSLNHALSSRSLIFLFALFHLMLFISQQGILTISLGPPFLLSLVAHYHGLRPLSLVLSAVLTSCPCCSPQLHYPHTNDIRGCSSSFPLSTLRAVADLAKKAADRPSSLSIDKIDIPSPSLRNLSHMPLMRHPSNSTSILLLSCSLYCTASC